MKNKRVTILLIITNIILIAILYSFIRINGSIIKEKQIIKEMSESTQVTDLNNQINALNTEHTEYMNYTQTCKAQLASAITDMGVETSEDASLDTMASNIRTILESSGNAVELNCVAGTAYTYTSSKQDFSAKFTPKHDTSYVIIGGTREGGVFNAYIKDSSGSVIASAQITAGTGSYYANTIKTECNLKADTEYTFYIPASNVTGNRYYNFAFVVYP